jgi:hypothetical protein
MHPADRFHPLWDAELDSQRPTDRLFASAPVSTAQPLGESGGLRQSSSGDFSLGGLGANRNSDEFSILMGIIVPIVCLVLDPIVFKGGDEHGGAFCTYWILGYGFIGLEVITLTIWLARRERLGGFSGIVAGILLAGSGGAFVIGVLLLPLSIMGLPVLIGILGFAPFLTAIAYLRQAGRALEAARSRLGPLCFLLAPLVGVSIALGLPMSAHTCVQRGLEAAVRDFEAGDATAAQRLRFWCRFLPSGYHIDPRDRMIDDEMDPARRQRLIEPLY